MSCDTGAGEGAVLPGDLDGSIWDDESLFDTDEEGVDSTISFSLHNPVAYVRF